MLVTNDVALITFVLVCNFGVGAFRTAKIDGSGGGVADHCGQFGKHGHTCWQSAEFVFVFYLRGLHQDSFSKRFYRTQLSVLCVLPLQLCAAVAALVRCASVRTSQFANREHWR